VFFNESGAHFSGEFEKSRVSGDLFSGFGDEKLFFKDTLGHFFKMIFKVNFVSFEVSNRFFELGFKGVERVLGSSFVVGEFSERVFDVAEELFEHTSDSANGTSVKEHVEFGGGHLGEESNDWGVVVSEVDFDTRLEEEGGVGRELNERSFFSNHIIEDTEGTFDNAHGVSVVSSSGNKESVFFSSGGGSNGKGGFGVGDVLDGVSKINFGFISGVFAGG